MDRPIAQQSGKVDKERKRNDVCNGTAIGEISKTSQKVHLISEGQKYIQFQLSIRFASYYANLGVIHNLRLETSPIKIKKERQRLDSGNA